MDYKQQQREWIKELNVKRGSYLLIRDVKSILPELPENGRQDSDWVLFSSTHDGKKVRVESIWNTHIEISFTNIPDEDKKKLYKMPFFIFTDGSYASLQKKWVEKHNIKVGHLLRMKRDYDLDKIDTTAYNMSLWLSWSGLSETLMGKEFQIESIESNYLRVKMVKSYNVYLLPFFLFYNPIQPHEIQKLYKKEQDKWLEENNISIGDLLYIPQEVSLSIDIYDMVKIPHSRLYKLHAIEDNGLVVKIKKDGKDSYSKKTIKMSYTNFAKTEINTSVKLEFTEGQQKCIDLIKSGDPSLIANAVEIDKSNDLGVYKIYHEFMAKYGDKVAYNEIAATFLKQFPIILGCSMTTGVGIDSFNTLDEYYEFITWVTKLFYINKNDMYEITTPCTIKSNDHLKLSQIQKKVSEITGLDPMNISFS